MTVLRVLEEKGISIRVASPKLVMEEVSLSRNIFYISYRVHRVHLRSCDLDHFFRITVITSSTQMVLDKTTEFKECCHVSFLDFEKAFNWVARDKNSGEQ